MSVDGRFAIVMIVAPGGMVTEALPVSGGPSVPIYDGLCFVRWQADGNLLYLSITTGMNSAGAGGHAYALPASRDKPFLSIPVEGFRTEQDVAASRGVRMIEIPDIGPGPPGVYAFSRQTVQRNLYRIPVDYLGDFHF
jgi:hypothetical protein